MIKLALAFWLILAGFAASAPVMVKSGEHDGFTRLVMAYGTAVDWRVGRSESGYVLTITNATPDYNLSEAFKLIGKSRLAGISTDPGSGDLHLAIACACYAIPFEFRPGIVVIDLRDGAPPKGSSFEQPSAAMPAPQPAAPPSAKYDWTLQALAQLRSGTADSSLQLPLAPLPSSDPDLQILRDSLLHQLSRGAAEGLVDVAKLQPHDTATRGDAFASVRAGLGALPGVSVTNGLSDHQNIGAHGQLCPTAQQLDVANWGDDTPIFTQIAVIRQGLIGEFDKADPAVVQRAIRFQLFLGFGAEAKQMMQAFPNDLPDRALWSSMALLVDGRADPKSAFLGQESCDSPAALWALLAQPGLKDGRNINSNAASRAFSALPIGLRRELGPALADRFIAIGASDAALRVRDAILRAPGGAGPDAMLLQAKINIHEGEPADAEAALQNMVADPGPGTSDALVGLVEARIAQDLPIAPEMVTALEAIVKEQAGTDKAWAATRAVLLAKAASGDLDGAFTLLPLVPDAEPQLWRILSLLGSDDAILAHAILPAAAAPDVRPETRPKLAERLMNLGLADSALHWLPDESQADPVLLATIQLQRHDGRGALRALAGEDSAAALALRAQAMQQLGDEAAAAQIYAQTGDATSALRALGNAENWLEIAARGTDPWKQLASQLTPSGAAENAAAEGPLAQGKRLVDSSVVTRNAVAALLTQVTAP